MSVTTARRLLWGASALLVPLPYLVVAEGAVPVVRFALLGLVAGAYAAAVDGSGVAWVMTALLLGHAVGYGLVLAAGSLLVVRLLPESARRPLVWGLVVVGFAAALLFEVYHTPFDDLSARARWSGLFQ